MKRRNKWIAALCSAAMIASMATCVSAEEAVEEGTVAEAEAETAEAETAEEAPAAEPERAAQVIVAEEKVEDTNGEPGIRKVYTVNHIYGDGQKVSNVIVEYNTAIDAESLALDTFEVKDRTITAVHTNSECEVTEENAEGNYVVLDLEIQSPILDDKYATDGRIQGMTVIDSATVIQHQDVATVDGAVIAGSEEEHSTSGGDGGIMGNDAVITPDMSKFDDNHYYNDPDSHTVLHYNFYKPEGYAESGEKYPLVLFIPDASAVGDSWEYILQQGNGGTVWTSEEWQAENPCFVVTMIYADKYINDYWEYYEDYMFGTMNLIRDLEEKYPVDASRVYTTGQSMGCMASMVMMEKDPDLFAAAYIMAGQWDPEQVKDIKDQNLLLLVSEDDPACARLDKNVAKWEEEGGIVARATFEGIADPEEKAAVIDEALSSDANICYLKIATGTGSMDLDGNALKGSHRMTWRLGYDLPGVKEWLFSQTK
ncbi:MAG: alpha/beta hydrolase-fold protein [Eubacteriales bacterium]|nr:alpha/beta hydrolase-fold protein [Eubacteriales bacterium]